VLRLGEEDRGGRPPVAQAKPGRDAAPGGRPPPLCAALPLFASVALVAFTAFVAASEGVNAIMSGDGVLEAREAERRLVFFDGRTRARPIPAVVDAVLRGGPVAARPRDRLRLAGRGQRRRAALQVRRKVRGPVFIGPPLRLRGRAGAPLVHAAGGRGT